jgi:DNA-binding response OmpR family regulator
MVPTVLIVEDSVNFVAPLEIALAAIQGIEVQHIFTAQEAFEMLTGGDRRIAALVTDLHLERADTFDLIERIRSDERYCKLPILVVSGDADPETPARLARLGANAFFTKPYSPSEIRRVLEALLNAH